MNLLPESGNRLHRALLAASVAGLVCLGSFGLTEACAQSDPTADLASLRVLDGFEVGLFGSEREGAIKPIAIRFDARGRLWVVGSTTYPQLRPGEPANDTITILEDTDGDGKADRSTRFAEGLLIPLGLELGDGGAYVASGTELLHLRDTDGDDRADERRVLLRGFGTGDAHQTLNSFTWGPCGELMMSQGLHAHSRVETPWGLSELQQAGLFRLWPRRLQLEAIWTGAMGAHNPFGTVFDRWGQPLVFAGNGHGVYHLTPALIATDHFLLHPALWQQGRKFGGADLVENAHWPPENQGEFVTGGYLQNTVERFRASDAGSTFRIERLAPLVESTNTAFRIVDVRFGPDGALYLADWYNRLIGHYQTSLRHPDRDRSSGRIWRVTARARPVSVRPALATARTPELLDFLASPDRWVRQQAKRRLADLPTSAVIPALDTWLTRQTEATPLLLVETLGVYASHATVRPDLLQRLSLSPESRARAFAARVTGLWTESLPDALERLASLVVDPDPRVRLEAVVALSRVRDPRAVEVAARATNLPMDSHLDYAFTQAVHALKPLWRPLQAAGSLTFGGNSRQATAFARADGSGDTVPEAASRLGRVAEVALGLDEIERLARLVARAGNPSQLQLLLRTRTFTLGNQPQPQLHASILGELERRGLGERIVPAGNLAAQIQPLLDQPHPGLREAAIRLAGRWQVDALRDRLAALAETASAEPTSRQAALVALGGYGKQEDGNLLASLATRAEPAVLRGDAISALAGFAPEKAAPLAAAWLRSEPRPAPDQATSVLAAFLRRRDGAVALATALEATSPPPELARAALALLAASGRRDLRLAALLEKAAGGGEVRPLELQDIPDLARAVRERGDPEAGRQVLERPTLACLHCHAVDGTPGRIGPDLGALGTSQTIEFILGAILAPQREVKEGFSAQEFETTDGDVLQGYVRGETQDEVVLLDHLSGGEIRLRPDRIAARRVLGSLMPSGLADLLRRDELRDLVAYLARLGRRD